MAKGFYELNIWKKGYALLLEIYKITTRFPKEEKYGLSKQMRDSAN
jgi:four helix bundle protein